jgi:hypothetical protein
VVRLEIYDVAGRRVRAILDGPAAPGERHAAWNGLDEAGRLAPAGVYFWRLETQQGSASGKVSLVR